MMKTEKLHMVSGIKLEGWKVLSFCHQGMFNNLLLQTPKGTEFNPSDLMVLEETDYQAKRIFTFGGKEILMSSELEPMESGGTCSATTFYTDFQFKKM